MTNDESVQQREFSDATVTAGYRALANEKTPGHLDAKIVRNARNATTKQTGVFRITAWLRPLAFAATAGLSIALLLELDETQILDLSIESQPPAAASGNFGTQLPDSAVTGREDAADFRDAAGQALEQVREVGASEDATLKEMPKATSQDDTIDAARQESSTLAGAATRDLDTGQIRSSAEEPSGCTTEQRNNPGDWMACIDGLERSGLHAIAAQELTELRQSFPHFLVQ